MNEWNRRFEEFKSRVVECDVLITETEAQWYGIYGAPPKFEDAVSPAHGAWWVSGEDFAERSNEILRTRRTNEETVDLS